MFKFSTVICVALPSGADGEGDAAQADGVFPLGLVSEGVAVVVLQRERFVLRPDAFT
jgi:hypothetical protein